MKVTVALLILVAGLGAGLLLGRHLRPAPAPDEAATSALAALERRVAALQVAATFGQQQCLAAVNQIRSAAGSTDAPGTAMVPREQAATRPADPAAEQRSADAVNRGLALLKSAEAKGVWDPEDQREWIRIKIGATKAGRAELFEALTSHFKDGTLRPTSRESVSASAGHTQSTQ